LGQCGVNKGERVEGGPYSEVKIENPTEIQELNNIRKIACGYQHSLAVDADGQVFGWGNNSLLQLSNKEAYERTQNPMFVAYTPTKISTNLDEVKIEDLAAGEDFSIFIGKNNTSQDSVVFGCGANLRGQ